MLEDGDFIPGLLTLPFVPTTTMIYQKFGRNSIQNAISNKHISLHYYGVLDNIGGYLYQHIAHCFLGKQSGQPKNGNLLESVNKLKTGDGRLRRGPYLLQ